MHLLWLVLLLSPFSAAVFFPRIWIFQVFVHWDYRRHRSDSRFGLAFLSDFPNPSLLRDWVFEVSTALCVRRFPFSPALWRRYAIFRVISPTSPSTTINDLCTGEGGKSSTCPSREVMKLYRFEWTAAWYYFEEMNFVFSKAYFSLPMNDESDTIFYFFRVLCWSFRVRIGSRINSFDYDFLMIQVVNLRGAVIVFDWELLFERLGFICFPSIKYKLGGRYLPITPLGGNHLSSRLLVVWGL